MNLYFLIDNCIVSYIQEVEGGLNLPIVKICFNRGMLTRGGRTFYISISEEEELFSLYLKVAFCFTIKLYRFLKCHRLG